MAPVAGESGKPVHYKLYGVLYHHGESTGSGNYTIDVLHPNEDGTSSEEVWLRIDDEVVSAVQHDDVFGGQNNDERGDNRCAYMLFYCRTASART
jgi:ubiquitin carboxyl-terminal hydrolase 10